MHAVDVVKMGDLSSAVGLSTRAVLFVMTFASPAALCTLLSRSGCWYVARVLLSLFPLFCAVSLSAHRVASAMRNLPEYVVSYIACCTVGAVAVLLNAWWTPKVSCWHWDHVHSSSRPSHCSHVCKHGPRLQSRLPYAAAPPRSHSSTPSTGEVLLRLTPLTCSRPVRRCCASYRSCVTESRTAAPRLSSQTKSALRGWRPTSPSSASAVGSLRCVRRGARWRRCQCACSRTCCWRSQVGSFTSRPYAVVHGFDDVLTASRASAVPEGMHAPTNRRDAASCMLVVTLA